MDKKKIALLSVFDMRHVQVIAILFVALSILLAILFIELDVSERFFEFSRHHENWELDEIFLALLSVIIAFSLTSVLVLNLVMTRLIAALEQQVEAEKKLIQNRKIQSMGSMLGGVAHSMNNHLQPILTLSRVVKNDLPENSSLHEDIKRISNAAESASQILKRILTFASSKNDTREKKGCNIASSTQEGTALAVATLPSSITLEKHIHAHDSAVGISDVDLEIIILNLFSNAVDSLQGQVGKISVSLKDCDEHEIEKYALDDSKAWVCLSVSDTGIGMNEEQKVRMFDPFYTTKAVEKGTGLGLSENYGIVTQAGGTIEVETRQNQGTSIYVYLPLLEKSDQKGND